MTENFELQKEELQNKSKAFMKVVTIFAISWGVLNGGALLGDILCWFRSNGGCGQTDISFCEKMAQSMSYIVKAGNESLKWLLICACVFYGHMSHLAKSLIEKITNKQTDNV